MRKTMKVRSEGADCLDNHTTLFKPRALLSTFPYQCGHPQVTPFLSLSRGDLAILESDIPLTALSNPSHLVLARFCTSALYNSEYFYVLFFCALIKIHDTGF
jgi:hypothetical protein